VTGRASATLARATNISKSFGAVRALRGTTLEIPRGQSLGIVGHNGAGKSTLMNILCGTLALDGGTLQLAGQTVSGGGVRWDVREARRLGVRRVFQELSLCANLTLAENMHVAQPGAARRAWRRRAGAALLATLDAIFPGHGLRPEQVVADLPIGKRQAVEIARAFTASGGEPPALMILDEPTSSLDNRSAGQLLAYIRRFVAGGGTCILTTHKLAEIFAATDRVIVMRDGEVVDDAVTASTDRARLVAAMGQDEQATSAVSTISGPRGPEAAEVLASARTGADPKAPTLQVRRGEVIGLAGLAGHGQTELLVALRHAAGGRSDKHFQVCRDVAFVAGDRQTDGVFPLWSIARNMSLAWLAGLRSRGLIRVADERAQVELWRSRLGLVTPDVTLPVLSLSGGNQQKVLFARALGSAASLVLMDDPMRGVDVGTKRDVYELIASEARAGRGFVWYTTEFEELHHCDRVYVFNNGRISGELTRAELSEERVLQLSFEDAIA
jgi:ribose transport system ATP-binding protein